MGSLISLKTSKKTHRQKPLQCIANPYTHQIQVQQVQVPIQFATISQNPGVYLQKESMVYKNLGVSSSFSISIGLGHLYFKTTHPKNSYRALGISRFLLDSSYKNGRKSHRHDWIITLDMPCIAHKKSLTNQNTINMHRQAKTIAILTFSTPPL